MKEKHSNPKYIRPKPLLWHIAIVPVIPFDTFANNMVLNKIILFTYPLIFIKTSLIRESNGKSVTKEIGVVYKFKIYLITVDRSSYISNCSEGPPKCKKYCPGSETLV